MSLNMFYNSKILLSEILQIVSCSQDRWMIEIIHDSVFMNNFIKKIKEIKNCKDYGLFYIDTTTI